MSVTVVNLPDLIASTDAIEATIKTCCEDYISYWNAHHQAVGGGLSDIGIALDNCCERWTEAGMMDIDIPASMQTLPSLDNNGNPILDNNGNPVMCMVECPGFTVQTDTYAESQYFFNQQYLAPYIDQSEAYTAYLEQLAEYQRLLNIPLIAAAVANGIMLVQLYTCWRETIEWAKDSVKRMLDDGGVQDKLVDEFCDSINGEYLSHVDTLQEGFAEKWMSVMDAADWQCAQRDAIYACYNDVYKDPEKEVVPMAIRNLKNALDQGTQATEDVRGWLEELQTYTAECIRPWEKENWSQVGQQIENAYGKLSFLCQTLQNGAQTLEDCYLATYINDEKPLITSLLQSAADCVPEINTAVADARDCMRTMKDLYDRYLAEEELFGPTAIEQANTLAQCGDLWKDLWTNFSADADDFRDQYNLTYQPGEEELQAKIFELACNMATEKIDRQHIFATNNGDGCIDQFNANYKITDAAWAPESLQSGRDFTQLQYERYQFSSDAAAKCLDHWMDTYQECDAALSLEIFQEAKNLVESRTDQHQFATQMADLCRMQFENAYQACDALLAGVLLDEGKVLGATRSDQHEFATDMAALCRDHWIDAYQVCDAALAGVLMTEAKELGGTRDTRHDFAEEMSIECMAHWQESYAECDGALAGVIMEEAKFLGDTRSDQWQWATDYANECLDHWQVNYKDCDGQLAAALMAEAKQLYDSRTDTFDTFCEMQIKYYDHWQDVYEDKEIAYVCNLLDRATMQITELDNSLEEFCQDALDHLNFWKDYYQDPECEIAPKIILAADQAITQHEDTYTSLDTYGDALWEKWYETFKECDCTDLEAVCQIHEKTDLVCDIDDNSDCIEDLGLLLKDCYEEMLPWEKAYLQEICDEPKYEPQYCELEDRAILFVRSQFDRQRQDIIRCADLYCVGDIEDRLERMGIEQAKAEAAVLQSANRFERWWETQECERRHQRKLSAIEVITSWRRDAAAMHQQSTEGKNLLLDHVHNRLVRGEMYLRNMNQALSTSGQQTAQTVDDALQSIQNGHFFIDQHADMKNSYHNSSQQMLNAGQQQTQIGQEWARQATNNKQLAEATAAAGIDDAQRAMEHGRQFKNQALQGINQADSTAGGAVDDAVQVMQHGRQFKTTSISAQQTAEQIATAAVSDGLQAMRHGQAFKGQAHSANGQAESIAAGTVSDSIQMANHGQRFKDQALNANAQADQIAASATDDGMQAMQHGKGFKDQAANFDRNAAGVAATAVDDAIAMANHGQRYKDQAVAFGQLGQEVIRDGINFGVGAIDRSRFWIEQSEQTRSRAQGTVEAAFDRGMASIRNGHEAMQMALAFEQQRDRMAELCVNNGMNAAAHGLSVMSLGDQRMRAATSTSQQAITDAMRMFALASDRDNQWLNGTSNLSSSLPNYTNGLVNLIGRGHGVQQTALNMGMQGFSSKAQLAEFICGMIRNQHNDSIRNMVSFQGYSGLGANLANSAGQGVGTTLDGLLGSVQGLVSGPSFFQPPNFFGNVPVVESPGVSTSGPVTGGNTFGPGTQGGFFGD